MKKMIVLMIGLGVILGGCRKKEKQEAASGQAAPEILVNRPAQHDVVYTYQYPAYLEAVQTVNLVARVSGFLEKMNYIPGVPVKAGQLLFVIEPQPYQDQLKAAQAEMKSTEARLAYARAQYEKMKEAMPSRAISEIDFIQAESDYHSAIANLQNARAQLNTAQTNLNYCYIKAPFDGRVSRNLVDLQNFVGGAVQPVTLATMYKDKYMCLFQYGLCRVRTNSSGDQSAGIERFGPGADGHQCCGHQPLLERRARLYFAERRSANRDGDRTGHSRKSERRIIKRDVC